MSTRGAKAFRRESAALGARRALLAVPLLGWHGRPNLETARASGGAEFAFPPPPVTVAGLTGAARAAGLEPVTVEVTRRTGMARVVVAPARSEVACDVLGRAGLTSITVKVSGQRSGGLHVVYGCLPEVVR